MKTPLFESHQKRNAKWISFAGWEMPFSYQGVLQEHAAVRKNVGIFDVSHMGRIDIIGKDTIPFLDFLSTNTVQSKPFGKALYTVFCDENGGAIDDLLVYPISLESAFIVVNAANREIDLTHLQRVGLRFNVTIIPRHDDGILSIQGPKSQLMIKRLFPELPQLARMEIKVSPTFTITRTGYTGEEGYEIFVGREAVISLWERSLLLGESLGISPCGLGARDVLRLEMGYALYGHELSPIITPIESVAGWSVKLKEHDFLGKQALISLSSGAHRYPVALRGEEGVIAREGAMIYAEEERIGAVTSGAFSPVLQKPIALGLIQQPLPLDRTVFIEVRQKMRPFRIVRLPFIP